ncbi:uncharacterized protein gask1a [Callorhinchus milii]|uniref:uncharacterized protein gask1a n=1 Tax=Callorhinchus milii TaxID=7868 RepID=UPI001C3FD563|nr:uncharacterized protein gask1a [Callorhinchus milii]
MARRLSLKVLFRKRPVTLCCFFSALSMVMINTLPPLPTADNSIFGFDYRAPGRPHGRYTQHRLWRNSTGAFVKKTTASQTNGKLPPMGRKKLKRWPVGDAQYNYMQSNYGERHKYPSNSDKADKPKGKGRQLKGIHRKTNDNQAEAFEPQAQEMSPQRRGMSPQIQAGKNTDPHGMTQDNRPPPTHSPSSVEKPILQANNVNRIVTIKRSSVQLSQKSVTLKISTSGVKDGMSHDKPVLQGTSDKKQNAPQFKTSSNRTESVPVQKVKNKAYHQTTRTSSTNSASDMFLANNGKSEDRRGGEPKLCNNFEANLLLSDSGDKASLLGHPPPWFNSNDIEKMKLLSKGSVTAKERIPGHGQVMQVGLSSHPDTVIPDLLAHCQDGFCGLIKRPSDLYEVLAFHLDRVLGLNRSLPVVARRFSDGLLPYRYTDGVPRPIVWWDSDIQHLDNPNKDQNSFELSWLQYQAQLQRHCGTADSQKNPTEDCLSVKHSEWGRLALFDFLLQVHDRLDRHCCGFSPEPSEPCVQELLRENCRSLKEQALVHILVRKGDPSRLVYIDNAARLLQPEDNLNFRLLEGIDELPLHAVSVLKSGCFRDMLLRSLYADREFWESHKGIKEVQKLVHTVERRSQLLLNYIQEKNIQVVTE